MKCLICNHESPNFRGLGNHVRKAHNMLRYPYYCDFYLPDPDIFVEINGYWMHNDHWFNENSIEDLNTLKMWKKKAKTSTRMQAAINVWTKLDIEKRNCAKNNKLNYVVLWTIEDIQKWIDSNFEIRHDY